MTLPTVQDKQKEIAFFDAHAASDEYDVFTPQSNARLIAAAIRVLALPRGARVVDLGCGSGVFTELLRHAGYASIGLDISAKLIMLGREKHPGLELIEGDAENLPFDSESVDGVLLSNLVHHFPDPRRLAAEVRRVLKRGGRFAAFDPNRVNPFMWLYRDRTSPFYSSIGVTENERPVLSWASPKCFETKIFVCRRTTWPAFPIATSLRSAREILLPIYNFIDNTVFRFPFMKPMRPFILTSGEKTQ